jgi:hypothetical protein
MSNYSKWVMRKACSGIVLSSVVCGAQESPSPAKPSPAPMAEAIQRLEAEIQELRLSIQELRSESERYRTESRALYRELEAAKSQTQASRPANAAAPAIAVEEANDQSGVVAQETADPAASVGARVTKLEDEYRMLTGKVDEQYQTKIESASRYRLRLSGIALLNLFSNRGTTNSIDLPQRAQPPFYGPGSFGGTLRQSQIGLEIFGPDWAGSHVQGDLRMDFAGGFPDTQNGAVLGLARLRTGTIRIQWPHTAIVGGQDAPFFSALSPTSLATLAEPALSYAGNLWTWVPQLRVEHSIGLSQGTSLLVEGGIMDPLTGDPPGAQFYRRVQAGEASRQPGYATRIAWRRDSEDRPSAIGFGGYFSPQNWGFNRTVDGWAATTDFLVPIGHYFELRGELYRGQGLGGLGASSGHSVVFSDVLSNRQSIVRGLDSAGGWAQVKFRATSTLEFNTAYGQDNPFSSELRQFTSVQNLVDPELGKNRSALVNFIYHPRSDLLFSLEYRHLRSFRNTNDNHSAEHINMAIGILF